VVVRGTRARVLSAGCRPLLRRTAAAGVVLRVRQEEDGRKSMVEGSKSCRLRQAGLTGENIAARERTSCGSRAPSLFDRACRCSRRAECSPSPAHLFSVGEGRGEGSRAGLVVQIGKLAKPPGPAW
jgi:hypothetical protein